MHMASGSFDAGGADPTVVLGRKNPRELLDSTLGALLGDIERPVAARRRAFDVTIAGPAADGVVDVGHGFTFYPVCGESTNCDPPLGQGEELGTEGVRVAGCGMRGALLSCGHVSNRSL